MFAVFGVTSESIYKEARKKMETFRVEIKVDGKAFKTKPDKDQWDAEFARLREAMKETAKPKQLSQKLATPALARQYLEMTRAQTWSRDLYIKAQVIEVDSEGRPVLTKSNKPKMRWVDMAEFEKAAAA